MASEQDSSVRGPAEQEEQGLAGDADTADGGQNGGAEQERAPIDDSHGDSHGKSHNDARGYTDSRENTGGESRAVNGASDLAAQTDLSGTLIGHYRVQAKLGGGTMAAVYRARDHLLDRDVALKVLLPGADGTTRERFRREAETVSRLEHPNIVSTYQVGQNSTDSVTYIAMELVTGNSLADLLERTGKLSAIDACALLQPVAQALEYAHKRDVVHRDVKPSNILLRQVKPGTRHSVRLQALEYPVVPLLSDFGIARALDAPELTSVGRTIGTPAFMSPEQCAGSAEIDGRADIYSLGAVLYRCIVGRAPYVGTTTQILHAHVYDPLLIPDNVLHTLPSSVVEILQRAMVKAREQRYPSAALMARDLGMSRRAQKDGAADKEADAALDSTAPDSTITMASLPVIKPDAASTSSTVLVPATLSQGLPGQQSRPDAAHTRPQNAAEGVGNPLLSKAGAQKPTTAIPVIPQSVRKPLSRRVARARRLNRGKIGLIALSVAVVALLVVLGVSLVNSILPTVSDPAAVATGQATSVGVDGNEPPGSSTDSSTDVGSGPEDAAGGVSGDASGATASSRVTPEAGETGEAGGVTANGSSAVTATAILTPTLVVSIDFAWDNAQAFYAEEAWGEALNWLIAVQRKDADFEKERLDEMLFNTYVALATEAALRDEFEAAVENLEESLTIYPDEIELQEIHDAIEAFVNAPDSEEDDGEDGEEGSEVERGREALQQAYVDYAAELASAEEYCRASNQLGVAIHLSAAGDTGEATAEDLLQRQTGYEQECSQEQATAELAELEGSILYSTQRGDTYQIYLLDIGTAPTSRLLIDHGAQPSLHPFEGVIAFYSTRGDYNGLSGFSTRAGSGPDARLLRYSDFVEDSRDSAPSWSPQGDRLVYSSNHEGDRRYRLYLTWADGSGNTQTLGFGKDPAWHPTENIIVYNGVDETGNNPGLWLVQSDGSGRRRITDNGNDIRPTWTLDGRYIVFMSQGRDGNWELYRVDVTDLSMIRLTNNPAQDGLPSISPDGTQVAFMSDRDGVWRIWYVSIEGGEERLLGGIIGQLTNWLEHAIQWVE